MPEANCNFIGGEWARAADSQPNINPSDTSDVVGERKASSYGPREQGACSRESSPR